MAEHEPGQAPNTEARGAHPLTGEPETRLNPGHATNRAGSDPVNRRTEGDGGRNDRPPADASQQATGGQLPPPPTPAKNEGAPANTTQADQREDSGR